MGNRALNMKEHLATKKLGKRTYTLKELAQRDFVATASATIKDLRISQLPTFNLANIQEELLGIDEPTAPEQASESATPKAVTSANLPAPLKLTLPIDLLNQLIAKELTKAAKALGLEEAELHA